MIAKFVLIISALTSYGEAHTGFGGEFVNYDKCIEARNAYVSSHKHLPYIDGFCMDAGLAKQIVLVD